MSKGAFFMLVGFLLSFVKLSYLIMKHGEIEIYWRDTPLLKLLQDRWEIFSGCVILTFGITLFCIDRWTGQ